MSTLTHATATTPSVEGAATEQVTLTYLVQGLTMASLEDVFAGARTLGAPAYADVVVMDTHYVKVEWIIETATRAPVDVASWTYTIDP